MSGKRDGINFYSVSYYSPQPRHLGQSFKLYWLDLAIVWVCPYVSVCMCIKAQPVQEQVRQGSFKEHSKQCATHSSTCAALLRPLVYCGNVSTRFRECFLAHVIYIDKVWADVFVIQHNVEDDRNTANYTLNNIYSKPWMSANCKESVYINDSYTQG